MSLGSPSRDKRLNRFKRQDFMLQGGSEEGGSRGIRREKGGIGFDSQAGTVSGRALVGAEGEEVSWKA